MRPAHVVQISDPHLGFVADDPDEPNRRRLDAVVAHIAGMTPAPDHVVVSGDLTERGDAASYAAVRAALAPLPAPVTLMAGNHDLRRELLAAFPEQPAAEGFVQAAVEVGPLRLLALDTLEEGRHAGAFCAARAAWLAARLDEAPDTPTLVVLHHPPAPVGIGWMDAAPEEPWIARLAAALDAKPQVLALAAGHLHRPIATTWQGRPLTVCPSTSPELALELAAIDPATPDDRPLIAAGPPGFALHRWDGERLVTHFGAVGSATVARFTPALQPMIAAMAAERPAAQPRTSAESRGRSETRNSRAGWAAS